MTQYNMYTKVVIHALQLGGLNKFTKEILEYIDVEWGFRYGLEL